MIKKILLTTFVLLISFNLSACNYVTDILNKQIKEQEVDLDEIYEQYNKETITENSTQTKNYELVLHDIEIVSPEKNANMSFFYNWNLNNTETLTRINVYIVEDTIEYELKNYKELEEITINEKVYKLEQIDNGYNLYYRKDNKAYLKFELYPIQTFNLEDNSIIETQAITIDLFNDENFSNTLNYDFEKKADSTLITDNDVVVLIQPEIEQEINYTDDEKQHIYKLIYSEEMAIDAMERLNKLGIYGIKSAKLLPSSGEYLVEIVDKTKTHYFVHIDMYKHTYAIQKDSVEGDYLYLEEKQVD